MYALGVEKIQAGYTILEDGQCLTRDQVNLIDPPPSPDSMAGHSYVLSELSLPIMCSDETCFARYILQSQPLDMHCSSIHIPSRMLTRKRRTGMARSLQAPVTLTVLLQVVDLLPPAIRHPSVR